MEWIILLVLVVTFGDPKWLGRHMAKARQWQKYYERERDQDTYQAIVKYRAKNIRKIRNRRFKNNDT